MPDIKRDSLKPSIFSIQLLYVIAFQLQYAVPVKINTIYNFHVKDLDWVTFTTPSYNGYYTIKTITTTAKPSFQGYLFDSNMTKIDETRIASSVADDTHALSYHLTPSTTYYLELNDDYNYEAYHSNVDSYSYLKFTICTKNLTSIKGKVQSENYSRYPKNRPKHLT